MIDSQSDQMGHPNPSCENFRAGEEWKEDEKVSLGGVVGEFDGVDN